MIPDLPQSGPLFNNLSQATCVGARKSNSARAPLEAVRGGEMVLEKAHSLYVFLL